MKIFIIAFIFLLSFKNIINTCSDDDYYSNIDSSASTGSCLARSFSEDEKDSSAYKCCYVKAKCPNYYSGSTIETSQCMPVTQYEYENIKKVVDTAKALGCKDVKIKCNSSYLKLALIYFILMIL